MTMLRPAAMRSIVGFAAVTVIKCPTVVAFVRPSVRHVAGVRYVSSSAPVSVTGMFPTPTCRTHEPISFYSMRRVKASLVLLSFGLKMSIGRE